MSTSDELRSSTRRQFVRGACGSTALLGTTLAAACKDVGIAQTLLGQEQNPLAIPPLEKGSLVGGERVFDLSIRKGQKSFGGGRVSPTIGINGPYLGPTLEMRRGETVRFNVQNGIDEDVSVHWHGFELPAVSDGGPHQAIPPGGRWTPGFEVRQRASLYWYHSHALHRSGPQVYAGLAAGIYVRDDEEDSLDLPDEYGVDDIPLVVQDRMFGADGSLVYPSGMRARMMGAIGDRLFVNGTQNPVFEAQTGLLRLRLLNGSNARIYEFYLDGRRSMQLIGSDGGLLDRSHAVSRVRLSPGERAQVVIDLSDGAPVQLHAASPTNSPGMMGNMGGMMRGSRRGTSEETFTVLNILPDRAVGSQRRIPAELSRLPAFDLNGAMRTRRFVLDMGMGMGMRGGFTINGASMDMDVINERVRVNEWEIWEIGNRSMMAHPFHIHNVQFRVLDRNGRPPSPLESGLKDTVLVEPGEQVRLLLRFEENTDPDIPYMYHCHILEHEDAGMMGQFVVVK